MSALFDAFLATNSITFGFIVATLGLLIVSLLIRRKPRWSGIDPIVPGTLTSLGVLGTFVGIVLGLLEFDPRHIDQSIDTLLEGLKTAFLTSIAGMVCAMFYQFWVAASRSANTRDSGPEGATADDLLRALLTNGETMDAVRRSIAGDEESSLVAQIKLMKSDSRDSQTKLLERLDAILNANTTSRDHLSAITHSLTQRGTEFLQFKEDLWIKLREFSELMSKSATEQVIEALKNVIVDFNRNLTQQFGENFKALDASVKRLVEWQDRYRSQIEQMIEQYAAGVTAIDATRSSVANIEQSSLRIPEHMTKLEAVLTVNQHQIQELTRHLQAFKELRDEAVRAVPEIQTHIKSVIKDVSDAAISSADYQKVAATEMHKVLAEGAEIFENNVNRVNASLQSTSDVLGSNSEEVAKLLDAALKDTQETLRAMVNSIVSAADTVHTAISASGQIFLQETAKARDSAIEASGEVRRAVQTTVEEVLRVQRQETEKSLAGTADVMRLAVEATGKRVNDQIDLLDKAMQDELNRALIEMGGHLTRITAKFTSDYESLVKQMDAVVRMGDRLA